MANVVVIYGSTTGNTEELAGRVAAGLKNGGAGVTVKNVTDASTDDLAGYDAIVFGCSTWGEGELQDDFIDFHEEMRDVSLQGKKVAIFGPGDSDDYPDTFCEAVNILEDTAKKCGAEIITESFKVDGDIDPAMDDAEAWGFDIAKSL